jgi:transketolase
MRTTFSRILTQSALANKKVLLLTGDHGYALFDEFRRECPDQYINCGIAEQNMVGVAAGLAKGGFFPIVYGLSAFVPMRVLEQIKIDVCYESLPMIFVGDGAGVVYSHLGASHQSTEDIAALRAVPNIDIFSPSDRFELEYCYQHMLRSEHPSYLRFGKADCGDIHTQIPQAPIGDLLQVKSGNSDFAILATGSMVSVAVKVAEELGNSIPVWSVPGIAPINREQLIQLSKPFKKIFVLEEHSVHGGLGGLVAETLSETGCNGIIRLGVKKFSELCGSHTYLMSYHGLGVQEVKQEILNAGF